MNKLKDKISYCYYRADRLRRNWRELLLADLSARASRRFPQFAYWVTLAVGARNVEDNEDAFTVPFMDVLHRQFLKTKEFSLDV